MVDSQPSSKAKGVLLPKNAKHAFDKTCLSWESRLTTKFFKGHPRGAFRRSCPLFHASLEYFNDVLQEEYHSKPDWDADQMDAETVERLSYELRMAVDGITQGLDQVTNTCWECDANLNMKNECTGCSVALYCGRACQAKGVERGAQ